MNGITSRTMGRLSVFLLIVLTLVWLVPFFWMFQMSIKPANEILRSPPVWITTNPTLDNYVEVFTGRTGRIVKGGGVPLGAYLVNSLVTAFGTTAVVLLLSIPSAYSLARFRGQRSFKGSTFFLYSLIIMRGIPALVVLIPIYILWRMFALTDTLHGLIIAYVSLGLPLGIWILRAFFMGVPEELEDSAMVDGCSRLGALIRIVLPVARPGVAVVGVLSFLLAWNDLLLAVILTYSPASRTLPISLFEWLIPEQTIWGAISASMVIMVIPPLVFSFVLQKYIVQGLTLGAVKG